MATAYKLAAILVGGIAVAGALLWGATRGDKHTGRAPQIIAAAAGGNEIAVVGSLVDAAFVGACRQESAGCDEAAAYTWSLTVESDFVVRIIFTHRYGDVQFAQQFACLSKHGRDWLCPPS